MNKQRYDFTHHKTGRAGYTFTWKEVPEGVNPLKFAQPSPEVDAQLPTEVRGRFWLALMFNQEPWTMLITKAAEVLPDGFEARYGGRPHPDDFHGDRDTGLTRRDYVMARDLFEQNLKKWAALGLPPDLSVSDQTHWLNSVSICEQLELGTAVAYKLHGTDSASGYRVHFPETASPTTNFALGEGDKGGFIDFPELFAVSMLQALTRKGVILAPATVEKFYYAPSSVKMAQQRLYREAEKARKAVA